MDPQHYRMVALAADATLAATTPDHYLQAAIAEHRLDLRTALAGNPEMYPQLRQWLADALAADTSTNSSAVVGATLSDGSLTNAPKQSAPASDHAEPTAAIPLSEETAVTQTVPLAAPTAPTAPEAWDTRATSILNPTPVAAVPVAMPASTATVPPIATWNEPQETSRLPRTWIPLIVVLAVVILAFVAAGIWALFLRPSGLTTATEASASHAPSATAESSSVPSPTPSRASDITAVTKCATAPNAVISSARSTGDAGNNLALTLTVTPTCHGGDVLSGQANIVTVYADNDRHDVAAVGGLSFAGKPLAIPADGLTLTVTFGPDQVFYPASDFSAAMPVTLTSSGTVESAEVGATTATVAATQAGDAASTEAASLAALQRMAARDYSRASGELNGSWMPQVSSKRVGLVLNGTTWDNHMVLQYYIQTKNTYPEAILLNSDEWSVFDAGGHWWVILIGFPYSTPEAANGWCDSHGLGAEDCFAKKIVVGGSSEGTTKLR